MTTASNSNLSGSDETLDLNGFTEEGVIERLHLEVFNEAMDTLNLPSAKPADLADVLAWILRPARIYKDGHLIYDGMQVPFSWQLACKAVGVDPDLYREQLVKEGVIGQELISIGQYIAEWKVVQQRDAKAERKLDNLLGPNCKLSNDAKIEVIKHLATISQFEMFSDFVIPETLPAATVVRYKPQKKLIVKPVESIALF
ncbi:MAG: hypothetical protein ACTS9Y_00940 [Methylophilus sp.]|uniref:hypothetical protein n=1 Tax=Methylophilus sp. TaxID=29541 RepID=UPI003F9FA3C4